MPHPNEMNDLEFMQQPDKWPYSFTLPLKQKNTGMPGFLYQPSMQTPCPPPKPIVYLGHIFNVPKDIQKKEYESLEAIAQEWWVD